MPNRAGCTHASFSICHSFHRGRAAPFKSHQPAVIIRGTPWKFDTRSPPPTHHYPSHCPPSLPLPLPTFHLAIPPPCLSVSLFEFIPATLPLSLFLPLTSLLTCRPLCFSSSPPFTTLPNVSPPIYVSAISCPLIPFPLLTAFPLSFPITSCSPPFEKVSPIVLASACFYPLFTIYLLHPVTFPLASVCILIFLFICLSLALSAFPPASLTSLKSACLCLISCSPICPPCQVSPCLPSTLQICLSFSHPLLRYPAFTLPPILPVSATLPSCLPFSYPMLSYPHFNLPSICLATLSTFLPISYPLFTGLSLLCLLST